MSSPRPGDLALVVAAHGRDELHTLRRGLESGLPYVGLVASTKRGTGVLAELRGDGVPDDLPRAHRRPGRPRHRGAHARRDRALDPREDRRRPALRASPPRVAAATFAGDERPQPLAIDPICGMTVAAVASTPSLRHDGETVYFCCEGCKAKFVAQHEHAGAEG